MPISRREFIKRAAALGAGLVVSKIPLLRAGERVKEKKERSPLRVIFSLGSHESRADAEIIDSLAKKHRPHFFAPEVVSALPFEKRKLEELGLRAFRFGKVDASIHPFIAKQVEVVERHGLTPVLLEVFEFSEWKKVGEASLQSDKLFRAAVNHFNKGEWREAIGAYRKALEKEAVAVRARDDRIVESITALAEQAGGKVLLARFGTTHTTPYIRLRNCPGVTVERVFDSSPVIYSHDDEATRRLIHGKSVSDELVAKAFLERIASPKIPSKKIKGALVSAAKRILFKDFSLADFRQVSDQAPGSFPDAQNAIVNALKEKGFAFLKTEKDFERLVKKHYPRFKLTE